MAFANFLIFSILLVFLLVSFNSANNEVNAEGKMNSENNLPGQIKSNFVDSNNTVAGQIASFKEGIPFCEGQSFKHYIGCGNYEK